MKKLILGDCLEKLKELETNSVDSIVTDPPYELGFMGKSWDNTGIANNKEMWVECLRVLKHGGHLLAFGGTRTYHRMTCTIEDAGFEVRDMIEWVYGSGFPKSLNIGKKIDQMQGNEREDLGKSIHSANRKSGSKTFGQIPSNEGERILTKGTSKWEGWGTALKPAHEPICMARKPLAEKSVAENCLKWGTGGINIDESRVAHQSEADRLSATPQGKVIRNNFAPGEGMEGIETNRPDTSLGRFPANLIHDNSEEVRECFPESKSTANVRNNKTADNIFKTTKDYTTSGHNDKGNASRFFKSIIYQAKASKSDRNLGLDNYLTVKHNGVIINNNKTLCKEENTVAVQLLRKVILEQELVNFNIDESGVNIMGQCHKDSLFTILTIINKIIESKILNLLMHSLTNEFTQDVKLETENGGSLAENVENLKKWIMTTTKDNQELALGASRVVYQMLQQISVKENWKEATNFHSTVKPTALMQYLITMITPKSGTVLDPFMGSGSTGKAAIRDGFSFIGIEKEAEYFDIAKARIEAELKEKELEQPTLF